MRFAQAYFDEEAHVCLVEGDQLVDLAGVDGCPATFHQALKAGVDLAALKAGPGARRAAIDQARFAPLAGEGAKLWCIGVNYFAHIAECGQTPPRYPVVFCKLENARAAHGQDIRLPDAARQVDYEAELVAVIGRGGRDIPEAKAREHIFGYACGNDLSARDWQKRTSQWLLGKTCDGFGPVGPWVVTADELDPMALDICSRVNGQVRQQANTSMMMYSVDKLVSYISQVATLNPGDMIFTGTPSGVILGMPEDQRHWLDGGDVVEVEIQGIGVLRNRLVR